MQHLQASDAISVLERKIHLCDASGGDTYHVTPIGCSATGLTGHSAIGTLRCAPAMMPASSA